MCDSTTDEKVAGQQLYRYRDGSYSLYMGHFKNDQMHGSGKLIYTSGKYFEGTFVDGMPSNGKVYSNDRQVQQVIVDGRLKDDNDEVQQSSAGSGKNRI